jgi:hypothetical protein
MISTAVVYMGRSSQHNGNYLVYMTSDSTMLVFDISITSKYLDQQQTNVCELLETTRPSYSNDGREYAMSPGGLFILDSFTNDYQLVHNVNETSYYGVATTITNVYLGCGSTKFYIYRIVSQQVMYLTSISSPASTSEMKLDSNGTKMFTSLSFGAVGV